MAGVVLLMTHLFLSPLAHLPKGCDPLTKLLHPLVLGQAFFVTLNLLMTFPEYTDYRLQFESKDPNVESHDIARFQPYTMDKLKWAFQRCFLNMRGIGWNYQYSKISSRPDKGTNKWKFIIVKCILYESLLKFLYYDIAVFFWTLTNRVDVEAIDNPFVLFLHTVTCTYPIVELFAMCLSATVILYYSLNNCYWITAAVSLIGGFSSVEDWPDMFQLGKGGTSMRAFWSIWWHQYISRDAYFIARRIVYRLQVNKTLRRYLIILFTFFIAGLIHAAATQSLYWSGQNLDANVSRYITNDRVVHRYYVFFKFDISRCFHSMFLFIYSAHIVMLEVFLETQVLARFGVFRQQKLNILFKVLGILWMIGIQSWPMVMYVKELEAAGFHFPQYHHSYFLSMLPEQC